MSCRWPFVFFFFQAEDGIRDVAVTGVQTCALPIFVALLHRRIERVHVHVDDAARRFGHGESVARRGDPGARDPDSPLSLLLRAAATILTASNSTWVSPRHPLRGASFSHRQFDAPRTPARGDFIHREYPCLSAP